MPGIIELSPFHRWSNRDYHDILEIALSMATEERDQEMVDFLTPRQFIDLWAIKEGDDAEVSRRSMCYAEQALAILLDDMSRAHRNRLEDCRTMFADWHAQLASGTLESRGHANGFW